MRASRELPWERNREDAARDGGGVRRARPLPEGGGRPGARRCDRRRRRARRVRRRRRGGRARPRSRSPRCGSACCPRRSRPTCVRAIGPGRARELFTSGGASTRPRPLDYGLVHHVVAADALDERVATVAEDVPRRAAPRRSPRNKRLCATLTASLGARRPARSHRRGTRERRRAGRRRGVPREAPAEMAPSSARLLIANRGEIAVRIVRACRELGDRARGRGAPSEERRSLPATLADAAGRGGVLPRRRRARRARRSMRRRRGASGLRLPRRGSATFAELVLGAGLVWVGPPPDAMRRARRQGRRAGGRAEAPGVPVVPGADVDGPVRRRDQEAAARLGAPAAREGRGGRRRPRHASASTTSPTCCRRWPRRAARRGRGFGDDRVFLERRLEGVRHVEVQVLVDEHGDAVHLGERDCSLQRRHQKIVEESPSPAVDAPLRASLGEAAIAIARRGRATAAPAPPSSCSPTTASGGSSR